MDMYSILAMRKDLVFQKLLRSRFLRNIATVMSGTVAAQAIGYAIVPVISRLYSPSDFGFFGSFNAIVTFIGAGVTLQYSQALMMPKDERDGINVLAVSCLSVLSIAALCACVSIPFPDAISKLLGVPGIRGFVWLLPVAVLINGLNQCLQAWCVRRKAFKRTAVSQVSRTLGSSGSQVLFGFMQLGGKGLVGAGIIGDAVANISLTRLVLGNDWRILCPFLSWSKMRELAKEYSDFALYLTPQNMLNAASQGLPVILLAHFFGAAAAGYYALGVRLIRVPMNLILQALRQVLFQKASETYNKGRPLYPLFVRTTGGLLAVSAVPAAIGFIWAPFLFSLILGKEWYVAGEYSRWLILWLLPAFCNVPSVLLSRILRQQRRILVIEIVTLISRASAMVLGGLYLSALSTVILFSVVGAGINLYLIGWIWMLTFKEDRRTVCQRRQGG